MKPHPAICLFPFPSPPFFSMTTTMMTMTMTISFHPRVIGVHVKPSARESRSTSARREIKDIRWIVDGTKAFSHPISHNTRRSRNQNGVLDDESPCIPLKMIASWQLNRVLIECDENVERIGAKTVAWNLMSLWLSSVLLYAKTQACDL